MSVTAAIRELLDAGFTIDQALKAAEVMEKHAANDHALDRRRASDAERTARYRDRMDISETEWQQLRWQVFERDKFTCQYCYTANLSSPHCDHIMPLILGGRSVLENLVCACAACNCGKSGRTPKQWRAQ